jgi:metal-dependent amidase/aminoacylase/carboxypeptidase family protein
MLAEHFAQFLRARSTLRVEQPPATMGAEDFAYFAQCVPGLLMRLGVRSESSGAIHPVHSPLFRLDEAALPLGVSALVLFAIAVTSGAIRS